MIKKLELFGDSILRGVTLLEGRERYSLCKLDYSFLDDYGIELENHGRMGYTIDKGMEVIEYVLPELNSKSFAILEFGGNDCNFKWEDVAKNPKKEFLPFTPEDVFLEMYINAIHKLKNTGALVAVATLPPLDSKKFFKWITKGLDSDAILDYLGDENMLGRWQEYYNTLVICAAKKTGVPVIDIRAEFLKSRSYQELLCEDGIHPTPKGYGLITEKINSYLRENLIHLKNNRERKIG